ncbi:hypothetical protein GEMRC1_004152 [Eukaryota sp. GEM-RC1]
MSSTSHHLLPHSAVVCLDVDGTLYSENQVVPGAIDFVRACVTNHKSVFFVTNNSTLTVDDYVSKLNGFGFSTSAHYVRTSAAETLRYLRRSFTKDSTVLVLGQDGLIDTLSPHLTVLPAFNGCYSMLKAHIASQLKPDAVVVGLSRYTNYTQMAHCAVVLEDLSVKFIATNEDCTFPTPWSKTMPGAGAVVKFVQTAAQRSPDIVVGKPQPDIIQSIIDDCNVSPEQVCMIGDRLNTDILAGKRAGVATIFVSETGVHSLKDLETVSESESHGAVDLAPYHLLVLSIIQRSGTGKTHSALSLSNKYFNSLHCVCFLISTPSGFTELGLEILNEFKAYNKGTYPTYEKLFMKHLHFFRRIEATILSTTIHSNPLFLTKLVTTEEAEELLGLRLTKNFARKRIVAYIDDGLSLGSKECFAAFRQCVLFALNWSAFARPPVCVVTGSDSNLLDSIPDTVFSVCNDPLYFFLVLVVLVVLFFVHMFR